MSRKYQARGPKSQTFFNCCKNIPVISKSQFFIYFQTTLLPYSILSQCNRVNMYNTCFCKTILLGHHYNDRNYLLDYCAITLQLFFFQQRSSRCARYLQNCTSIYSQTQLQLTFRNLASYIQDGRKITLYMPHFIFIQQISVLNILNMLCNLNFFCLQNAVYFILLPCLVSVLLTCITHILNTECAEIWGKKNPSPKG